MLGLLDDRAAPSSRLTRLVVPLVLVFVGAAATAVPQDRGQHGRLFPPQDVGLLEGPDRDAWQRPDRVMDALGIADGSLVADLGAGGGWFTIRLARRVGPNGVVYAEDVQPPMIEAIKRRVEREGLRNVTTVLGNQRDPRLPEGRLDAVLIVDAFHEMIDPVALLRNASVSLKPKGRLGIIEFRREGGGPGGALEERVDPSTIVAAAEAAGLRLASHETFLPFQHLLVFMRNDPAPSGASGR
jgi:ubiquinone/menaquinone biosynthesis C-methylase UbiE